MPVELAAEMPASRPSVQPLKNGLKPFPGFVFVIGIAFLKRRQSLAANFLQLLIDVFAGLAEQRIGCIAQGQHAVFEPVEPQIVLVDMVIEFFRGGWRFAVALCADHGQKIFFFGQVVQAVLFETDEFGLDAFLFGFGGKIGCQFFGVAGLGAIGDRDP